MTTMIHEVSMAQVMKSIQVKVRFERTARVRFWIATRLMIIAGWVARCDISIDEGDSALAINPSINAANGPPISVEAHGDGYVIVDRRPDFVRNITAENGLARRSVILTSEAGLTTSAEL